MVIKKSATPRGLPPVHPGLQQKLREAEEAEKQGVTPRRRAGQAQRILRPTLDAREAIRQNQIRTIGLIDPVYRAEADGLGALADTPAFKPGVDLDEIWDDLSEGEKIRAGAVERFRLELSATLRRAAKSWEAPHVIAKTLTSRLLGMMAENLHAKLAAFDDLLAPDTLQLMKRFVDTTAVLLREGVRIGTLKGVDGQAMNDILEDLFDKLIYQELVSRRRAMGDRGIRRIMGNIEVAETLYAQLMDAGYASLRERILMRIIHVHQDLGHTAYAARLSFRGSKLHRAYGTRIFTDEMNRYRPLLTHQELAIARAAVATHSSEELPLQDARVIALVRAVDHLAPFAPHRVYLHLRDVPGASDYLDDLVDRVRRNDVEQFLAAKNAFGNFLALSELSPVLQEDILASFRAVERQAEPFELGDLGGNIEAIGLRLDGNGEVLCQLAPDAFAIQYQVLFDYQQDQLHRVGRRTGEKLPPESFERALRFAAEDSGALVVEPAEQTQAGNGGLPTP